MSSRRIVLVLSLACLLAGAQLAAASEAVTITLAGSQEPQWVPVYQAAIAAFEAAHPNIKIDYRPISGTFEDLIVEILAGVGPDVFIFNSFDTARFHELGLMMPLNDFIQRDHYDLEQFFPPMVEAFTTMDGSLVALPADVSTVVMYYNNTLFAQAGVPAPGDDFTWDDMLDAARKTTRRNSDGVHTTVGVDGIFWREPWTLPSILKQNGGEFLSADKRSLLINSPESTEAIQWWADLALVYDVAATPAGPIWGPAGFINGNIAMIIHGTWNPPFWLPQIGESFDWDVAYVPSRKQRASALAGAGFAINAHSTKSEAAWEFLKFWLSDDPNSFVNVTAREIHLGVPSLRSAVTYFDDAYRALTDSGRSVRNYAAIAQSIPFAEHVPVVPYWDDLSRIVTDGLWAVWNGRSSARAAVDAIVDQANAMIREALDR